MPTAKTEQGRSPSAARRHRVGKYGISGGVLGAVLALGITAFGQEAQAEFTAMSNNNEVVAAAVQVAPGDLDTSFSGDGRVTTDFGTDETATSLAFQPDGKIIVVGTTGGCCSRDLILARYNSNGSLDTTFSGDGVVITDFGGDDLAGAIILQPDGKIVVASNNGLARYTPTGALDPTFSGDGKVSISFLSASALALQPDGKIVVAGGTSHGAPPPALRDFALARYTPNGSLDTTFSGDGKLITDFGGDDLARARNCQEIS